MIMDTMHLLGRHPPHSLRLPSGERRIDSKKKKKNSVDIALHARCTLHENLLVLAGPVGYRCPAGWITYAYYHLSGMQCHVDDLHQENSYVSLFFLVQVVCVGEYNH